MPYSKIKEKQNVNAVGGDVIFLNGKQFWQSSKQNKFQITENMYLPGNCIPGKFSVYSNH